MSFADGLSPPTWAHSGRMPIDLYAGDVHPVLLPWSEKHLHIIFSIYGRGRKLSAHETLQKPPPGFIAYHR